MSNYPVVKIFVAPQNVAQAYAWCEQKFPGEFGRIWRLRIQFFTWITDKEEIERVIRIVESQPSFFRTPLEFNFRAFNQRENLQNQNLLPMFKLQFQTLEETVA
jgi:hypothetical protein